MRKKMVAGNWKMNLNFSEAEDLIKRIDIDLENYEGEAEVVLCVPYIYLELALDYAYEYERFKVGSQNLSQFENGAYTGEISASMLKQMDLHYTIIGHSERRNYFNEDNPVLIQKVLQALKHDIKPIFCCGEPIEIREKEEQQSYVKSQLENTLFHLNETDFGKVSIAYEPIWAIGTGKTATPEQAEEMHQYIRNLIAKQYNDKVAEQCTVLYGGSCNAKNAKELFAKPNVDGGLIGGASLKAEDFLNIINSF